MWLISITAYSSVAADERGLAFSLYSFLWPILVPLVSSDLNTQVLKEAKVL